MLNLALVALLSGWLLTGTPDGDKDKDKTPAPKAEASAVGVATIVTSDEPEDAHAIINDTYAFGRASTEAPLKLWVQYAYGTAEAPIWLPNGEEPTDAQDFGDFISQRAIVGAQINVINFPAFRVGLGGQLAVAQNKFELDGQGTTLDSGFGLQNVKAFLSLQGSVIGIHGAYLFDLADDYSPDPTDTNFDATAAPRSDNRNAVQVGADFDYPFERVRLFGGVDYFLKEDGDATYLAQRPDQVDGSELLSFNMGAGLRFGFFEIGAALLLRTQFVQGTAGFVGGGHSGTVAPYLKVSPPSLPVSLFVKGAVLNEYTDYGYALGGANDIKPNIGFTAGLTLGFY